jgi:hypothetical protein
MPLSKIAANATLADVVDRLKSPEEYVRGVLGNLFDHKTEGGAVVRIGVMGRGLIPHYRLDRISPGFSLSDETPPPSFSVIGAFNGRNHKPLVDESEAADILHDEHWSAGFMTLDEVRALIGVIRGARDGRTTP